MTQNNVPFPSLETPAILVDMDKLEANIKEMAQLAATARVKLRPHCKSHKSPYICKLQLAEGAIGISASKLSEAAVMADEGIEDIMIVHPFYGEHKLERLKRLLNKPKLRVSVVVDMIEQAEGISQVGQAVDRKVPVLLKIDTGVKRFGCLPGEPALNAAKAVCQLPGIELVGILTHEAVEEERTVEGIARIAYESAAVMAGTAKMLEQVGIQIQIVAVGATPTARFTCRYTPYFPEITEIHPGAYVFGDWMLINAFCKTEDTCSATVLTTVVSTPSPDRAAVDAGAKTLGLDPLLRLRWKPDYFIDGKPSYGSIKGRPDLRLERLTDEIGIVRLTDPKKAVNIGDRLEILPNHISYAVNLHDKMYGIRDSVVEREIPILCRGNDR